MFLDQEAFCRTETKDPRRIWSKGKEFAVDSEDVDYEEMILKGWLPVHDCDVSKYHVKVEIKSRTIYKN